MLDRFIAEALALAGLTGEPVELADAPHRVLPVPVPSDDPRQYGLEEKTRLLAGIEAAARGESVRNTRAVYTERYETIRFASSEGVEYAYELGRSGFNVMAVAEGDGVVQMGYERQHAVNGFPLRTGVPCGEKARGTAVALLGAKAAKGGRMRVVLDPELAGVFAHEAVGHAAEGDLVREGNSVLAGRIGERIGVDDLDGVTVDLGGGSWFNLRSSNTEPLLRLNVEAPDAAAVDAVVQRVAAQIETVNAAENPRP